MSFYELFGCNLELVRKNLISACLEPLKYERNYIYFLGRYRLISRAWLKFIDHTLTSENNYSETWDVLAKQLLLARAIPRFYVAKFEKEWRTNPAFRGMVWLLDLTERPIKIDILSKHTLFEACTRMVTLRNKPVPYQKLIDLYEHTGDIREDQAEEHVNNNSEFRANKLMWINAVVDSLQLCEEMKDDKLLNNMIEFAKQRPTVIAVMKTLTNVELRNKPILCKWCFFGGLTRKRFRRIYWENENLKRYPQTNSGSVVYKSPIFVVNTKPDTSTRSEQSDWKAFEKLALSIKGVPDLENDEKTVALASQMIYDTEKTACDEDLSKMDRAILDKMDPLNIAKNFKTPPLMLKKILCFHIQMIQSDEYRKSFDQQLCRNPECFNPDLVNIWFDQGLQSNKKGIIDEDDILWDSEEGDRDESDEESDGKQEVDEN